MLVDSHCHLDFPDFATELPEVVSRAKDAGVGTLLTICTHVSKFPQVLAVAEAYPNVYCTVGTHPHEAGREAPVDAARLMALADHPKVVGFGETGLDFYYNHSPKADQERSFRAHIAAARAAGLPIIIHTRDADDTTAAILREEMAQGAFTGVLHCFSSGRALAEEAVDLGLFISLSGIVTFKSAKDLQETVRHLPKDRLLVETDSPYLAPVPNRGKRNEPAFTVHTAAKVAELVGLDAASLAAQTTANFHTLFSKVPSSKAPRP
ncbi:MAG: TatD family hydrolase [Magnetospiraceae bacterium]